MKSLYYLLTLTLFLISTFCAINSFGQTDFKVIYETDKLIKHITGIAIAEDGNILILGIKHNSENLKENVFLLILTHEGSIVSFKEYQDNNNEAFLEKTSDLLANNNNYYFIRDNIYSGKSILTKVNASGEILHTSKIFQNDNTFQLRNGFCFDEENSLVLAAYGEKDAINFLSYQTSNFQQNIGKKIIPILDEDNLDYRIIGLKKVGDNFILIGWIRGYNNNSRTAILLKITDEGEIQKFTSIPHFQPNDLSLFSNQDIIISGSIEESGGVWGGTGNLALIRIDEDFNQIWAKKYDFTDSGYTQASIEVQNNDEIFLFNSHSLNGVNTNISKLNQSGEFIWSYAYTGISSHMNKPFVILPDGEIVFASRFSLNQISEFTNHLSVIKTKSDGTLTDGSQREVCINEPEPLALVFQDNNFITEDLINHALYNNAVFNETIIDSVSNIYFEPPLPTFSLQSQICENECATISGLSNDSADKVLWYFENGTPEISSQKEPGQICFSTPGIHTIRQSVFYNNCEETFEKQIEVIPNINIDLGFDQSLCEGDTLILSAENSATINYIWSNGNLTSSIAVTEPNIYIVTASNLLCSSSDTIVINEVVYDTYPISMPQDTTICEQDLPYRLKPNYSLSEEIMWQDNVIRDAHLIEKSGLYTATINIDGCLFSSKTLIETKNCRSKLFIPNIFSPNDDGINDIFSPQGESFEVTEMNIFDRWGNLIYYSNTFNSSWDGNYKGKIVENGIFLYVIKYNNTLLNTEEIIWGDISVLR